MATVSIWVERRPPAYRHLTASRKPILQRPQAVARATRYDKLAAVYRGGVVLRAVTIWSRL